eukprot:28973-Prorocentrum_minimum.AAC.2
MQDDSKGFKAKAHRPAASGATSTIVRAKASSSVSSVSSSSPDGADTSLSRRSATYGKPSCDVEAQGDLSDAELDVGESIDAFFVCNLCG